MPKYMVHGYIYEPSCDGADKNGVIHFWDVIEAANEAEAKAVTEEDYGDYNTIEVVGVAKNKTQEKSWVAKNDS